MHLSLKYCYGGGRKMRLNGAVTFVPAAQFHFSTAEARHASAPVNEWYTVKAKASIKV